ELGAEQERAAALLAETKEALQDAEAAAARVKAELAEVTQASTLQAAELKTATTERDRAAAELTGARARRKALAELAESFQGYAEGARVVLTASRKGELPTGFRPLLEALRVPPGLEAAVEAALGLAVQAVIAPSLEAAR